jgi:hypothetical protein
MVKLPFPEAVLQQHIIALAKTRSGKSSAMRLLVEHLLDQEKPVCIIDPKGDWWGIKSSADGKKAGYPIVIFGGPHADVPINAHSGTHVAELVATGNRPCLIDLGGWYVSDRTQFFIDFAETLFRMSKGMRHLVIDEVHNFAPKGKVMSPQAGMMLHWANRLASEGLGKGIALIAASQRPQKVHNDFLTSCETLIAMRVIHKSDRIAFKEWIEGCADETMGNQVLNSLAQMKRGEAWVWSPEAEFGPERVNFPMFKTYDSFKAQNTNVGKLKGWAGVDLEEVKAKLATVIEEAEKNDPKKLRAQVASLQRDLATAQKRPPAALAPAKTKTREICLLKKTDIDFLEGALSEAKGSLIELESFLEKMDEHHKLFLHDIYKRVTRDDALIERLTKVIAQVRALNGQPTPTPAPVQAPRPVAAAAPRPEKKAPQDGLGLPEQRVLDAIAWFEAISVNDPQRVAVAFIAKYSVTSSSFTNTCGSLRTRGMVVYTSSDTISLTAEGRSHANLPETMPTTEELHRRIFELLGQPERRVLDPIIKRYPEVMLDEELAEASGYSVTSSSFTNAKGRLRSLGLIRYPQAKMVMASEHLFPDQRA